MSNTFKLTNERDAKYYIGTNFRKYTNATITMSLPTIIDKILNSLGICNECKMYDTPANVILIRNEYGNGGKKNGNIVQ